MARAADAQRRDRGRRRGLLLGGGLVAAVLLASCGSDGTTVGDGDDEPLRIGVVTSLTGDLAPTGAQVPAGVELAAQEWNRAGGIGGRQVQVVITDDRSEPGRALAAFEQLVAEADPVAVWGPTFTPHVLAMEPAVLEAQVPVFVSTTAPVVTERGSGWFFRTRTNDTVTGRITAQVAVEELGAQTVAFLYPDNDFGTGAHAILAEAVAGLQGRVVAAETYPQGAGDLTAQLTRIQQADADLLISWTVPGDSARVVDQARSVGLGVPILGGPGFATEDYLDLAGEATDGHYAMADAAIAARDVGGREEAWDWVDAYQEAHPDVAVSFVSSLAYDSANMLFQLIADGTQTDGDSLRTALLGHPGHDGVSGTLRCDAEGNCLHQADVIRWNGTGMEVLDRVELPSD